MFWVFLLSIFLTFFCDSIGKTTNGAVDLKTESSERIVPGHQPRFAPSFLGLQDLQPPKPTSIYRIGENPWLPSPFQNKQPSLTDFLKPPQPCGFVDPLLLQLLAHYMRYLPYGLGPYNFYGNTGYPTAKPPGLFRSIEKKDEIVERL